MPRSFFAAVGPLHNVFVTERRQVFGRQRSGARSESVKKGGTGVGDGIRRLKRG